MSNAWRRSTSSGAHRSESWSPAAQWRLRAAGGTTSGARSGRPIRRGRAPTSGGRTCGVHPFYVPRSDPDKIDVNLRCIDGIALSAVRPKSFDGQHWEAAMAGRLPWRGG